jgi:PPOX class probable F420-dependent enzyme
MLDPGVRRVLDGQSIAHLATTGPDGSPHSTPVDIGTHENHVNFFTGPGTRKARNLQRDPQLALSIAPAEDPLNPVLVRGRVADGIEGDAACEIIDKIVAKYIDIAYPRENERVVAPISVDRQRVGMR